MKYTTIQYAAALSLALKGRNRTERKKILERFLGILRKERDGAKLERILKAAEMLHLRESGLRKVRVDAASVLPKSIKTEIKKLFGGKIYMEERENPELLAGLRIWVDEEIFIDASAKRQLEKLFLF